MICSWHKMHDFHNIVLAHLPCSMLKHKNIRLTFKKEPNQQLNTGLKGPPALPVWGKGAMHVCSWMFCLLNASCFDRKDSVWLLRSLFPLPHLAVD